jgi:hypothetical protein
LKKSANRRDEASNAETKTAAIAKPGNQSLSSFPTPSFLLSRQKDEVMGSCCATKLCRAAKLRIPVGDTERQNQEAAIHRVDECPNGHDNENVMIGNAE